jgi:hypothetical protein
MVAKSRSVVAMLVRGVIAEDRIWSFVPPDGSTLTGVDPHAEYYRSCDSRGAGPRPVQR